MNTSAVVEEAFAPIKSRRCVMADEAVVLADVYQDDCNMAVWRRDSEHAIGSAVAALLSANSGFQASMTLSPVNAAASVRNALGGADDVEALSQNVAELVDMFCCLFDLNRAGLRMTALTKAMCPKFHVDHVPCRLITTYRGAATEWLPHEKVNRSKLGRGSLGQVDEVSGIYSHPNDIQQLSCGDVALLKGERWIGNEGGGLVHRSPALAQGEHRFMLTLDFA